MTLLVAVLCSDGVVLGSDSGATLGNLGQQHVMVPMPKVEVIRGSALIAVSGPVGLGQLLAGEFERVLKTKGLAGASYRVMGDLRKIFWEQMKPEWEAAEVSGKTIGNVAVQSALSSTLLAMVVEGKPCLFAFNQQGAPEEIKEALPVVSAGSGQHNADVFLAFLRGVYWSKGKTPTLAEGVFTTLWALEQCIEISPGALQSPSRIFTLVAEAGKGLAREVPANELEDHYLAIASAKEALIRAREEIPAPAPPKPEES